MTSSWSRTCAASGWAKIVRIAAATISCGALRDLGEQVAQEVDPAALPGGADHHRGDRCLSPVCASEITSLVPVSPRAFSERRNAVQNAPSSVSPTANPRTSRRPSADDPGGDHDGLRGDPGALRRAAAAATDPGLAVGGVQEHVRERRSRTGPGRRTRRPRRRGRRRSATPPTWRSRCPAPNAFTRSSTLRTLVPVT